jgi:hypothetical protein
MGAMTYSEKLVSAALRAPAATAALKPSAGSFQRPGPDVLSEAIPAVFIGRNSDGFWVVRDANRKFGGLFWRKRAALDFARRNAAPGGYAAVFPQARFELDIDNRGNPAIEYLGAAGRLLSREARRLIGMTRKHLPFRGNHDTPDTLS